MLKYKQIKAHELILGIENSDLYFDSVKHFDFPDVPDAKVAVPPQKTAEGRIKNKQKNTCCIVLFYIITEAAESWVPQRKILDRSSDKI